MKGYQMPETKRSLVLAISLLSSGPIWVAKADCMRGTPEPVFSKASKQIKSRHFRRINAHEAVEGVVLSSGAEVQIRHWGCEYYAMTFTITDPSRELRSADLTDSIQAAADWLRILKPMKQSLVFDFGLAAAALEGVLKAKQGIGYDQEIPVPGDGTDFLQTMLRFSQPEGPKGEKRIIITFSKGPL